MLQEPRSAFSPAFRIRSKEGAVGAGLSLVDLHQSLNAGDRPRLQSLTQGLPRDDFSGGLGLL